VERANLKERSFALLISPSRARLDEEYGRLNKLRLSGWSGAAEAAEFSADHLPRLATRSVEITAAK